MKSKTITLKKSVFGLVLARMQRENRSFSNTIECYCIEGLRTVGKVDSSINNQ